MLSFVLSVLIGRVLGEEGLGVYTTALAWVFPLSLVAEFGLGTLMTRDIAAEVSRQQAYLAQTTRIRLWIGGCLTILLILIAPILSGDELVIQGLQISAPLIVILPFYGAFTAIFRARQVMWPIALLNVGMLLTQVILTALVFAGGGGVMAALVVNTGTSAGQLLAAWLIYRSRFYQTNDLHKFGVANQWTTILRRAWPFAIAAILAAAQTRVSVILLEQLTNTSEVGYYAAASRFVEAGRMLPNALFGALFPALAALVINPTAFQKLFRRVMIGLLVFGLFFGIGFSLFAQIAIDLTYGETFNPAISVLQLAAWSLLPGLLRGARTLYWYAYEREQFVNIITVLALIGQVILSLWLIPILGALGVAVVNVIVETTALILLWRPFYDRRKP